MNFPFPFKTLTLYRVKKEFISERSNHFFPVGAELLFTSSTLNHYDGIEICTFKNRHTGEELIWHLPDTDFEKSREHFVEIPWPR